MTYGVLDPTAINVLQEFSNAHKNLIGVITQREQHDIALNEIHELLKEIKTSRNQQFYKMYGGVLIVQRDKEKMIKMLQERKEQLENALNALKEQETYRKDYYSETAFKAIRILLNYFKDADDVKVIYEHFDDMFKVFNIDKKDIKKEPDKND